MSQLARTLIVIIVVGCRPCPRGAELAGKGPPDGDALWCEKQGTAGHRVKEGPYHAWTVTGRKSEDGYFRDGLKEGRWTSWWENGQKSEEGLYRRGMKEGPWISWYDSGEKADEGEYR